MNASQNTTIHRKKMKKSIEVGARVLTKDYKKGYGKNISNGGKYLRKII